MNDLYHRVLRNFLYLKDRYKLIIKHKKKFNQQEKPWKGKIKIKVKIRIFDE
jgi:hypothetical protein